MDKCHSSSLDHPSGSTTTTSPEFIAAQWSTDNSLLFAAAVGVMTATAVIELLIFRLRNTVSSCRALSGQLSSEEIINVVDDVIPTETR